MVHPDKVPGDAARQAFEHLNQAYRELRDPDKLEELLRKAAVQAKKDKEKREAAATAVERIEMNARANEKKKELRKNEVKSFQSEIMQQMQKRKDEAARKRQATSSYRRKQEDDGDALGAAAGDKDGGGSSEDEWQRRKSSNKRKKVFI